MAGALRRALVELKIKEIVNAILNLQHQKTDKAHINTLRQQLLKYKVSYEYHENNLVQKQRSHFIKIKSNELTHINDKITALLNKHLTYLHERAKKRILQSS